MAPLVPGQRVPRQPTGIAWVDMDPAVKAYTVTGALDLKDAVPFNATAYLATLTASLPVAIWADQVRDYGLVNTPPYPVEVRPTLFLNDMAVAAGSPVHPGAPQTLVLAFGTPGMSSATAQTTLSIAAGGVHAVGLDLGTVPQRLVDERTSALAANPANETAVERERLTLALLRYFQDFDRARDTVTGVLYTR